MAIKLFDLVSTTPQGRFFSPACVRVRLALMTKGVDFETVEITYHDLRFTWTEKLGMEKATAPFIQREDGSYLMDSLEIALWLDKTFPDRVNLFMPEAPLPVDVESAEYKAAVETYKRQDEELFGPSARSLAFSLYAPRIVPLFDRETQDYWTSDKRLGQGVWKRLSSLTPEDDAKNVQRIKAILAQVSAQKLPSNNLFFSSPSKPGFADFSILGSYRLIRSTSAKLAAETFGSPEAGEWPNWLQRMSETYPLPLYWERDPQE
ncbi:hypothetical protein JCM8547_004524 [Rhodosporidiobolus lusitaniae]